MSSVSQSGGASVIASRVASVLLVVATVLFWIAVLFWLLTVTNLTMAFWGRESWVGELGERVFMSAVLVLVPGLAVLGYANGSGWARFGKAGALLVIGVVGVVLAAAIAIRLYPDYPGQGPHEWVAATTILPAVALPAGVMARWKWRGMNARSWKIYVAFSVLVLGGTIALFDRKLETALPFSVAKVTRWQPTYESASNLYLIRAEGIDGKAAERYATDLGLIESKGAFGCGSEDEAEIAAVGEWKVPDRARVWGRDDRLSERDTDKYPSGLSGCVTRVAWGSQTLLVCQVCDWGI